jgi:DNA-binding transcriptional MerR regulator
MTAIIAIGDFSRATHMSVKMLRHYHQIGLLGPADVDPDTNYRRYTAGQIPTAQVIRRFRELQMPLERIRDVLGAPDPATRNALIASHLDTLQDSLTQTQAAVASLRNLLDGGPGGQSLSVTHTSVEDTPAAAITETVRSKASECGCAAHSASSARPSLPRTSSQPARPAGSTTTICSQRARSGDHIHSIHRGNPGHRPRAPPSHTRSRTRVRHPSGAR